MRHMLDAPRNPADMTPSQRRREIATILAKGILRLRQCATRFADTRDFRSPKKASELRQIGLDVGAELSPDVLTSRVVNAART